LARQPSTDRAPAHAPLRRCEKIHVRSPSRSGRQRRLPGSCDPPSRWSPVRYDEGGTAKDSVRSRIFSRYGILYCDRNVLASVTIVKGAFHVPHACALSGKTGENQGK